MVNSTIPEELQQIIKDIIANKEKEMLEELDDDILDRLYAEIQPEDYYYPPAEKENYKIVIEM